MDLNLNRQKSKINPTIAVKMTNTTMIIPKMWVRGHRHGEIAINLSDLAQKSGKAD
jgi:hypothetical protein